MHRIDRNTSGLVICAKTAAALRVMNEKIKRCQIDKRYRCLVHGTPKPAEGRIELFMRKRRTKTASRYSITRCRTGAP